jgi:tetratricopeptide (TPR) repeat protein
MQSNYLGLPLEEMVPLATEAADNAARLNPQLAEPHMIRANIASKKWDLISARQHLEEAVAADKNHGIASLWLAISYLESGYLKAAQLQLQKAIEADPLSAVSIDWLARTSLMLGDDEAAIKLADHSTDLGRWQNIVTYQQYYLPRHEYQALRDRLEFIPIPDVRGFFLAMVDALEDPGLEENLISQIKEAVESGQVGLFTEINAHQTLGRWEQFLQLMPRVTSIDATRQLPGFKEFARNYGLLDLWKVNGWPDLCRPLGEDDFECD